MKALVTSGPTYEPLDPVRFLGNYSSGRQGHAIAEALAERGVDVTLITGPVSIADPPNVHTIHVTTAREMLMACEAALPVDIAVCVAAVVDWRPKSVATQKIKKTADTPAAVELVENPDILRTIAQHPHLRPKLVVGFAAETENLLENARAKRLRKGCDWIVANDVSGGNTFQDSYNKVTLITAQQEVSWERMDKKEVAIRLATAMIEACSPSR